MFLELNKKKYNSVAALEDSGKKLHMEKFVIIVRKRKYLFRKEVLFLFYAKTQ